ncbi:DUF3793 family protein [Catonella massiliensis]|uniref:DUF3793 family protein n=1 Tax=Catonella massiliensis TaxID=2799636 RepID=A0ABS1IXD9_9FIRM|nr:DUF3793 family protein [Catonella massiliensis]MBK5896570.1 DUF3793 family protein [Catonella massiliensis]
MSFDIVDIIKEMDVHSIPLQLALQCAPVISGIKISNLLTIPAKSLRELSVVLKKTELSFRILYPGRERLVILIFREAKLREYLAREEVMAFIYKRGYETSDISKIFPVFVKRYMRYMELKQDFPHELGLFLGYPIEDVEGFIKENGKNYLYSGYWKVYKDTELKIRLFKDYERVQTEIVRLLYEGLDIMDIITNYSNIDHSKEEYSKRVICA